VENKEEHQQTTEKPHNAAFTAAFQKTDLAESFFRNYLPPEIVRHIDFDHLEYCNKTYVDEKLIDKHSDVVYRTRFSGKDGFLYLLFEHQSTPDPMMAFRLLCYMVNIWKEYIDQNPHENRLPMIVPLVLYHGKRKWNSSIQFSDMIDGPDDLSVYIPGFTYRLYDLGEYEDDMLMVGDMALRAMLRLFKHIFDQDFGEHLDRVMELLAQISESGTMLDLLELVVRYVYNARSEDEETVRRYIEIGLENFDDVKAREVAMTAAEQIRQRGKLEGLQEGRVKSINLLMKLIRKRFGGISPNLEQKLQRSDLDILDRFGEKFFDFENLKDAERWMEKQGNG